jgi:hypothetical protein
MTGGRGVHFAIGYAMMITNHLFRLNRNKLFYHENITKKELLFLTPISNENENIKRNLREVTREREKN